jgi:hypothetical protein
MMPRGEGQASLPAARDLVQWPAHHADLLRRGIPAEELDGARLRLLDAIPRGRVFLRQAREAMEQLYERAGYGLQFHTTVKGSVTRPRNLAEEWAEECLAAARDALRRAGLR